MVDPKNIVNAAYHSALITGIVIGYVKAMKMVFKNSTTPKFNLDLPDIGMTTLYISSAILLKDYLIKQKIIPNDITIPLK